MKTQFKMEVLFPLTGTVLYKAWLDSEQHSAMTGGEANTSDKTGEHFDAWDGYIQGKNLELEPCKRILQSWRTSNFKDDDPDSRIEILFDEEGEHTRLTLIHTDIPEGQPDYEQGWHDHYFNPMRDYFSKQ